MLSRGPGGIVLYSRSLKWYATRFVGTFGSATVSTLQRTRRSSSAACDVVATTRGARAKVTLRASPAHDRCREYHSYICAGMKQARRYTPRDVLVQLLRSQLHLVQGNHCVRFLHSHAATVTAQPRQQLTVEQYAQSDATAAASAGGRPQHQRARADNGPACCTRCRQRSPPWTPPQAAATQLLCHALAYHALVPCDACCCTNCRAQRACTVEQ
jgi:hypothetical protein